MKIKSSFLNPRTKVWYDDTTITIDELSTIHKTKKLRALIECLHNDVDPAYITYYNEGSIDIQIWITAGQVHRIGGPAVCKPSIFGTGHLTQHYLWDKRYPKEDYEEAMKFLEENGDIAFKLKYKR